MSTTTTPTRSIPAGIAFILASLTLGVWVYPIMRFPLLLLVIPICLSLQVFLVHRGISCFGYSNSLTKKVDGFFYESRNGSMALLALSIIWGLLTLWGGAVSVVDLWLGGSVSSKLNKLNPFIIFLVQIMTFFTFIGVLGWVAVTAAKALWRITSPEYLDEESGMRLADGEDERDSVLGRFRL